MIKKITFAILFCVMIISCGKKGDPEYKELKKKVELQIIAINKA